MNTIIEEIRKRIEARKKNTYAAGDSDEYADGTFVGLEIALHIIDEVEKEHPVPADVQEAALSAYPVKEKLNYKGTGKYDKNYQRRVAYAAGMLAERERLMKDAPVADVIEMRGNTGPFADYPFMLSLGFRKIPNIEYHGGKVRVIIEEIK